MAVSTLNLPRPGERCFRLRNLPAPHADGRQLRVGEGIVRLQLHNLERVLNRGVRVADFLQIHGQRQCVSPWLGSIASTSRSLAIAPGKSP